MANTSIEVVLKMPFLSFNNANVEFTELEKLTWRSYTVIDILPTTSLVELIDKREFTIVALDKNSEIFMIHVAILEATTIHLSQTVQKAALYWDKAPI